MLVRSAIMHKIYTQVFKGLVSNCSTYFGYSEELAEYFLQMFSPETAIKFFEADARRCQPAVQQLGARRVLGVRRQANEQQRPLTLRTNTLKAPQSA